MALSNDRYPPTRAAVQHRRGGRSLAALGASILSCTALTAPARAQDTAAQDTAAQDQTAQSEVGPNGEIVVTGALNALPLKGVGTVFGFDKTLAETPRAASSVSSEQIERFGITQIYDLISQVPGTFTNSYFGTGGALDIRGSPGETYFRGVRRLDNPGNYPTPIGASDRIDIVRGPASPIYGPSKTGGYINFVPKSARAANGTYASEPGGFVSYTRSSWNSNVVKADVTGPGKIGNHEFGYSLYGEIEDSGSYYRNMDTKQTIVQASFDTDITSSLRTEFGGMFQHFAGQQNGGWNRLTQQLVDNGTYITGQAKPLDTNGDGQISREEAYAANGGQGLSIFGNFGCPLSTVTTPFSVFPSGFTDACLQAAYPDLALTNSGTAKLSRRDTLTGKDDFLKNNQKTAYFDLIYDGPDTLEIKNQLFYDRTDNRNNNDYGFSQFIHSYVIEDKIVLAKTFTTDIGKFSVQASPSIRYTRFFFGDDFDVEEFHRVDLTQGYTALSNRLLSNECNCDYTDYLKGHYTDYGFAGLTDLDFDFGLDVVLGVRYDTVDALSYNPNLSRLDPLILAGRVSGGTPRSAKGNDNGWSYNASVSYKLPFGVIPYVTVSQQSTIVVGEGSEVYPEAVAVNNFIAASKLYEAGIKGEFLDKRLYAAVSVYKQSRTDFNNQNSVTNQSVKTKGVEAEVRWSVDRHLLVSAAYTLTNIYELTGLKGGTTFSFFGIGDLVNVNNPALYQGGQLEGLLLIPDKSASRRAGIPKNLYSATATYAFDNGIALSGDVSRVDAVYSGQSQAVRLPSYWLLNLGASYTTGPWLFRAVVKNVLDERYFRANFTELFGSTIALPERPRNFQATIEYKF